MNKQELLDKVEKLTAATLADINGRDWPEMLKAEAREFNMAQHKAMVDKINLVR